VTVQKVWVSGVDITCLSGYHIGDQFVSRCHERLEKVDDD
jgi:hypothetical protein